MNGVPNNVGEPPLMLHTGTMDRNHGPSRTPLEGDAIYESAFLLALSDPNTGKGMDRTLNSGHFLSPPTATSIYPTGAEYASSQHPIIPLLVKPLLKIPHWEGSEYFIAQGRI